MVNETRSHVVAQSLIDMLERISKVTIRKRLVSSIATLSKPFGSSFMALADRPGIAR